MKRRCIPLFWSAAFLMSCFVGGVGPRAAAQAASGWTYTLLHAFSGASNSDGNFPMQGLILGSDGNLYGTTYEGGNANYNSGYGYGTVFQISTLGALNVIHSFTGSDGYYPNGLVQDGSYLYGTAGNTVFKTTLGGQLSTIYAFGGTNNDAYNPVGSMLVGSGGYLYGASTNGGEVNIGAVFKVSTSGSESVIYQFTGSSKDGAWPTAGLVADGQGNLYGTTGGGTTNYSTIPGAIFKLTPSGTLTGLHTFTPSTDGAGTYGPLVLGPDGDYYGTTNGGGANSYGTVFKVSTSGSFSVVHTFTGGADGGSPTGGLILGNDDNFYGTTWTGGPNNGGTIFQLTPAGALTTIYAFSRTSGQNPQGELVQTSDGAIYGTTQSGGSYDGGGVYKIVEGSVSNQAPTLTSISPDSAEPGSAQLTISVTGTNFVSGSTVYWNNSELPTTFVSATQLTATVAVGLLATTGAFDITVDNPSNGGTSGALSFVVSSSNPAPTLSAISPTSGVAGSSGVTLTITGSCFIADSQVDCNSSAVTTTYVSSTELTAAIPATDVAAVGTLSITVVNPTPGGGTSSALTYAVTNPPPSVSSVSDLTAAAGGAAITVTITGSGFISGVVVDWNGAPLATTYVSSTKLTAVIPSADLANGGNYSLTVVNPGAGSPTSAAQTFTVDDKSPVLSSVNPDTAPVGATSLTITVSGSKFVQGSQVNWNGAALATTYVSPSKLSASVPASYLATSGTCNVTVFNPAPGGGVSKAVSVKVENGKPVLTSVSPSTATTASGATTITLTGSNFVSGSVVKWGSASLAVTYVSSTDLTAAVPASDLTKAGKFEITVINLAPGGGTSKAAAFTVTYAPPVLTGISPNSVTHGSPALKITVTGSGFRTGAKVRWNGTALTTTYISSGTMKATIPAADLKSAGTFNITVATPAPSGGTSDAMTFTVN